MRPAIESEIDGLFSEEVPPMTLHILLTTAERDGLVWATERSAFLGEGHGNFATVEKIRHLKDQKLAFSAWGDAVAVSAISTFGDYAVNRNAPSGENELMSWLGEFANSVPTLAKRMGEPVNPSARGLFVASLGRSPRVYRVSFREGHIPPSVMPIYDQAHATAGDVENPANLFVRYYYPRCKRSIEELLLLGVHTLRLAKVLNSYGVGDPDVWACKDGVFEQLGAARLLELVRRSESLDEKLLAHLRNR
jgi:hypothetical protein